MGVNESSVVDSQAQSSYRSIFDGYVAARAKHLLECVQQPNFVHSSNNQKRLIQTLQYSLRCPDSWQVTRDLLVTAAPLMQRAGYRDEWAPYLQMGIEKSQEYNDLPSLAQLNYELGFIYQTMGQSKDAQTHYEVGISKIECGKDRLTYAKIVNKLAFVKRLQQLHDESEQLVLELLPQLEPTEPEYGKGHLVLGWIAFDKHDWEKSEYHFRTALDILEADSNSFSYASGLRDLATVLQMQQRYELAIGYHQESLQIFEEMGESHMGAVTIMNLGIAYLLTKQPQQALDHFRHAELEFRRVQDVHHMSLAYLNMGIAYRELTQLNTSIESILSAVDIWGRIGSTDMLVNMLDELGVSYTKAHQKALAISTFTKAMEFLDKIYDERVRTHYRREILIHLEEAEAQLAAPAS